MSAPVRGGVRTRAGADSDADAGVRVVSDADMDGAAGAFSVDLDVYSGPFDALLRLIAEHRLEVTEVSLAAITEEFLAHVRGLERSGAFDEHLDEASSFVDVAAVLVEAKSAALLPSDGEGPRDGRGMRALRERDLLFARLLQYRAYRQAALALRERWDAHAGEFAHPGVAGAMGASGSSGSSGGTGESGESGPAFAAALLPELAWSMDAGDFARLAARTLASGPPSGASSDGSDMADAADMFGGFGESETEGADVVSLAHLHAPLADQEEQTRLVSARLRALGEGVSITFAQLSDDASGRAEIVARFLAVLALFKRGALRVRQDGPFEPLHLRWVPEYEEEGVR